MKIFIVLIVLAIATAFTYLIYMNFGGEKTNQILIKTGGFIAVALVLLSYDIFSVNNELSKSVKLFIPQNEYGITTDIFYEKLRYQNPERSNGYEILKSVSFLHEKEEYKEVKIRDEERRDKNPKLNNEYSNLINEERELYGKYVWRWETDEFKDHLKTIRSKKEEVNTKVRNLRTGEDAQFRDNPTMDLLEIAFWSWLSKNYPNHWQVVYTDNFGISGWGGGSINQVGNAEKEPRIVKTNAMQEILKHNIFEFDPVTFMQLALPKTATISMPKRERGKSVFEIKTKNLTLKVTIKRTGESHLEGSKVGEKILSESSNITQSVKHFRVNFKTRLNKLKVFSQETERQIEWVKGLQQKFYDNFDWSVIKPDLEKAYFQ